MNNEEPNNLVEPTEKILLPDMVLVEGGTFRMGGNDNEFEMPVHVVTVSSFRLATIPVTQQLWESVMGNNPSGNKKQPDNPVENVSWESCKLFITALNEATKRNFRLPTEAEWEFAAQGGNVSQRFNFAGSNVPGDVAWHKANSKNKTQPVKTLKANELGLHDMNGNVWEWCQDWHSMYSETSVVDPKGTETGEYKIVRGGGYMSEVSQLRPANRKNYPPNNAASTIGFRLAEDV